MTAVVIIFMVVAVVFALASLTFVGVDIGHEIHKKKKEAKPKKEADSAAEDFPPANYDV